MIHPYILFPYISTPNPLKGTFALIKFGNSIYKEMDCQLCYQAVNQSPFRGLGWVWGNKAVNQSPFRACPVRTGGWGGKLRHWCYLRAYYPLYCSFLYQELTLVVTRLKNSSSSEGSLGSSYQGVWRATYLPPVRKVDSHCW